MSIHSFEIVSVPVSDQQRAKQFYRDVLGFELIREEPMGPGMSWIQLAPAGQGVTITLVTWFEKMKPGGLQGVMVNTDDIESDPALAMPVTADSLTGSGLATFSHAGTFDPIGVGSGTGTLSGTFLNTSGGIGRGVAGSFDAQVTGGEDGTYHMTGAFSGDYAGKVPN